MECVQKGTFRLSFVEVVLFWSPLSERFHCVCLHMRSCKDCIKTFLVGSTV